MRTLIVAYLIITASFVFGQTESVWMRPNRGQWHANILYRVGLTSGDMYLEKQGFTYAFHNASEVYHKNHDGHKHRKLELKGHAVKTRFLGSNAAVQIAESDYSSSYSNYFLGNNPAKWKSQIRDVGRVLYTNLYPSIDMEIRGTANHLKYSFTVGIGKNPSQIQFQVDGAKRVYVDEIGNLHTKHPFGEIIENAPIAWTIDAQGKRTAVLVRFKVRKKTVSFEFPEGYNTGEVLVIDPELTFSTFSGATSDNWGFTAAPDAAANVFAAGIVFGAGYPVSPGAYDPTYNGGSFDIGITKFNAQGTALIYSSFIGGLGVETPHSIICNANNELYIMGATSSADFPMPGTPYDPTFNGGSSFTENGLTFNGSDIFVTRLNATGTQLLSSTFIGGSGTDGINRGVLHYNYGDQFRGDIALDNAGNVLVASTTESNNFPIVNGFQFFLNGIQDAVVFKMTPNLSALTWSTFFGGAGVEVANSLQIASTGDVYVAGGSTSASLGFPTGNVLTNSGGLSDGFVMRMTGNVPFVLGGSFIGTNEFDQAYFVQLDLDNQVYIYGQTEGTMPISTGVYGTPNSGQFLRKYTSNLATLSWSTTIGAGTGHVEISPTAFLVSDCFEIYISGWGGAVNSSNSSATFSSSNGFQVTPDAFQSNTNGSNFYIAVLGPDAAFLEYATYMGGFSSSSNHVDGGTSRFDKSGRIYHAVCGACQGNDFGFTTTPGVWAPSNPSSNCNLAAFKFELNQIEAIVSAPEPLICLPSPVTFNNNSANGNTFFWDFGDNTTSNLVNPSHTYSSAGVYEVTLVVSDSSGCFSSDTTQFIVNIGDFNGNVVAPPSAICPGEPYQFQASGGAVYSWSPAAFLNDPSIPNPIATIQTSMVFTVVISDSCGSDTLTVPLNVFEGAGNAANDTTICIGNSVQLEASGGSTYVWTPAATLSDPTVANPIATPSQTTTYNVVITSGAGCVFNESIVVQVVLTPPNPVIPDTVGLCLGVPKQITVSGADNFIWSPAINISPTTGATVSVNPTTDQWYYCDFINACGTIRDSVFVDIVDPNITAGFDTIICPGESTVLYAFGGVSYVWQPENTLNKNTGDEVVATPNESTVYYVVGIDENGCIDTGYVSVNLFPKPFIQTVPDVYAFFGDIIQLGATSTTPGPFVWTPAEYLSCVVCNSPYASPDQNMQYTVSYTDENGCVAKDSVQIFYNAIIYVPNTFTPEGNLFNEVFKAVGGNVRTFEMTIFNRWGERIKTMHSMDESWDGTYDGKPCPDGTYVWKIVYTDFQSTKEKKLAGHINLLR